MALVTVTGHLYNSFGQALNGASVTFRLTNLGGNLPVITGTNIIVPIIVTLATNSSGFFTGTLQGNDTISPANTLYDVSFADTDFVSYSFVGAGPINLDSYPPVNVFPVPSGPLPSNILTSNNTFTGTNNFTGVVNVATLNYSGPVTFTQAATFASAATFAGPTTFSGSTNTPTLLAVNTLNQTSSIGTTTLYAVPVSGAGIYRVSVSVITTSTGTGNVTATITYQNGVASIPKTASTVSLASLGAEAINAFTFYSAASQNISYATTYATTGTYAIRIRLEYLG